MPTATQIDTAIKNIEQHFKVDKIVKGKTILNKKGNPYCAPGGLCRVYKFELEDGSLKALRLWTDLIEEARERSEAISNYIIQNPTPYFVNFEFIDNALSIEGEMYPAVIMDWCDGQNMKEYISENIKDTIKIRQLAESFLEMVKDLHRHGISHGDLHHENIMITDDGKLRLIDYDSMYVPALKGYKDHCGGYPGYQHPTARVANELLASYVDYYSELIIYLSLYLLSFHPELWTPSVEEFDKELLLRVSDLQNLDQHKDFSIPGLPGLIERLKVNLSYSSLDKLKPLEKQLDIVFPTLKPIKNNRSVEGADISKITNKF